MFFFLRRCHPSKTNHSCQSRRHLWPRVPATHSPTAARAGHSRGGGEKEGGTQDNQECGREHWGPGLGRPELGQLRGMREHPSGMQPQNLTPGLH